jgi:hypothetical protein
MIKTPMVGVNQEFDWRGGIIVQQNGLSQNGIYMTCPVNYRYHKIYSYTGLFCDVETSSVTADLVFKRLGQKVGSLPCGCSTGVGLSGYAVQFNLPASRARFGMPLYVAEVATNEIVLPSFSSPGTDSISATIPQAIFPVPSLGVNVQIVSETYVLSPFKLTGNFDTIVLNLNAIGPMTTIWGYTMFGCMSSLYEF